MSPYAAFVLFLAIGLADPSSLKYDPDMDDPTNIATTTITTTTITTAPPPPATTPTTTAPPTTTTTAPPTTTTTAPPTTTTTTASPTTTTTTASPTTTTTTAPPTTTTTTAPPTTTTTTAPPPTNTTTTEVPKTTSTVPTTPAPTLPSPTTHLYQVKKDNVVCLMAKFGLRFGYQGVKYEEMNFEFTNQTNVTGSCEEDSSEMLIHGDTVTLKLTFLNDTKKFSLYALNATGKTSSGVAFTESNSNLTLWQASIGNSYMCNKEQNFTITKQLTIFTFELQVQPFGVKKESFSTAEDCMPAGESFIVPIAVGVALLVLILIVLVAYFIGRKRNMASAEECFLDSDLSFLVPIAVGVALSFLIILVLISYLIGRRKSRTGYQSV